MAINFPSNPSNGQTHSGFTYNSSVGAWESTASNPVTQATLDGYLQVANVSSTTTVYTALSDLPMSGNDTGAQAYVSGTNRLYLWNGTGWYNIALINTNPTISGASASYNLNSDGSNTVVTLVASDPEGLPITFTASHAGLGVGANAIATVTQSNNIFTFTPTTNTALGGTFTTTFTASDGVNLAGANSSFTLAFIVNIENSNYTTALITSVGTNNQVNNTFVDSSNNSHTITVAGNATQSTFSPYRHGGYSTYFDGTGDYLSIADDATLRFGTGEFTVECWIYMNSLSRTVFIDKYDGTSASWQLQYRDYNNVNHIAFSTNAGHYATTPSDEIETNTWYHVAVVRDSSNNVKIYIDGVEKGSSSSYTQDLNGTSALNIGVQTYNIAAGYMNGYISDVRIVKGVAVYTSAFTPPTERLTAITNTSLLTCHLPYIADGSTNGHSITVNGDTKTEPFAPYDYETYSATDNGGSIYFDGTGDWLTVSSSTELDMGTGDFTIDGWLYQRVAPADYQMILSALDGSAYVCVRGGGTGGQIEITGAGLIQLNLNNSVKINTWYHLAVTRSSGTWKVFINGKSIGTASVAGSWNIAAAGGMYISRWGGGTNYEWPGSMSDLRIIKGTAIYTSNFTPPTAPSTAITNTSLLINGTNAGIIDKSQSTKALTLNGNVTSSTTQTKYLTSSIANPATTDYLVTELPSTLGTGDFTIEWWAYFTNLGDGVNYRAIIDMRHAGDTSNLWLQESPDGTWNYYPNYPTTGFNSSTFTNNTWHHIAIARESGTIRFFVDGGLTGSGADTFDYDSVYLTLNHYTFSSRRWTGYASDLRVTKGLARYTANFTPPTAALQG